MSERKAYSVEACNQWKRGSPIAPARMTSDYSERVRESVGGERERGWERERERERERLDRGKREAGHSPSLLSLLTYTIHSLN